MTAPDDDLLLIAAAGALIGAWWYWRGRPAPAPLIVPSILVNAAPKDFFNPASDQSLWYRGANAVVPQLPGATKDDTLGTWLYNITH